MATKAVRAQDPSGQFALRIFRVSEGSEWFIRTLAHSYGGLFTHWFQGASRYCQEEDCPAHLHKLDKQWKGYTPVEVWDLALKLWIPSVLEITERLELDFRLHFQRAQVWRLTRNKDYQKKRQPVFGKLIDQLDEMTLPEPFEILPVLQTTFHRQWFNLNQQNPLPLPPKLAASPGLPPRVLLNSESEKPLSSAEIRERLANARPKKNTDQDGGKDGVK